MTENENNTCRPIRLRTGDKSPARLGGKCPQGIVPTNSSAKYFLTLPCDDEYISVFLSFPTFIAMQSNSGKLIEGESEWVEIIEHKEILEVTDSVYQSDLSECVIEIQEPESDLIYDEFEEIYFPTDISKVGGKPHLIHPEMKDDISKILDQDYELFIQIGTPRYGDHFPSGNWPFGQGLFYLFKREIKQKREWASLWDL